MGVSKRDVANVAKFSGLILGSIFTGGAGAAAATVAGAVGTLLGGGDDNEEDAWKRKMFPEWIKLGHDLVERPINDDARVLMMQNRIDADWTKHYGKRPKRSHVEKLHADIVFVVKAEIAST